MSLDEFRNTLLRYGCWLFIPPLVALLIGLVTIELGFVELTVAVLNGTFLTYLALGLILSVVTYIRSAFWRGWLKDLRHCGILIPLASILWFALICPVHYFLMLFGKHAQFEEEEADNSKTPPKE
jgi:hypothetical protein